VAVPLVNLTDLPLAAAAVRYAERGLAVLPCQVGDKPPLWGLGWEGASTDAEQVADWWSREPRANIGVACTGELVVVDVDGPDGEGLLAQLGPVVTGYQVNTGRRDGGRHLCG
jgi:Bifunctional DNA primase/polymerase, N-terminal